MENNKPKQGYKHFTCHKCGRKWEEATRDAASQSSSSCELCYESVMTDSYKIDETLPVDKFGNLKHD